MTWVLVLGSLSPSLAPAQVREGGRRGGGRAPALWGAGEGAGREAGRQPWAALQTLTWGRGFRGLMKSSWNEFRDTNFAKPNSRTNYLAMATTHKTRGVGNRPSQFLLHGLNFF